jgi:hypothetical protein
MRKSRLRSFFRQTTGRKTRSVARMTGFMRYAKTMPHVMGARSEATSVKNATTVGSALMSVMMPKQMVKVMTVYAAMEVYFLLNSILILPGRAKSPPTVHLQSRKLKKITRTIHIIHHVVHNVKQKC